MKPFETNSGAFSRFLGTVLLFAARYTHNRSTGGTLAVTTALEGFWHLLEEHTKKQIVRESTEAIANREDWRQFREMAAAAGTPLDIELPPYATDPVGCVWRDDGDGNWETDCGNTFTYENGGPGDNHAKWCQYCGLGLIESPAPDRRPEKPDPAAEFAVSWSLYEACAKQVTKNPYICLSEAYSGGDEFLRQVARIGRLFERWACAHVEFASLEDVWPYALQDRFGDACLQIHGADELRNFDEKDCLKVALKLKLPLVAKDEHEIEK
jgi:hypothetical protein